MRWVYLLGLILLSGCYYPYGYYPYRYYGYPSYGYGYGPRYAPGYGPYRRPFASPEGGTEQPPDSADQMGLDPNNCGTPDEPHPCRR